MMKLGLKTSFVLQIVWFTPCLCCNPKPTESKPITSVQPEKPEDPRMKMTTSKPSQGVCQYPTDKLVCVDDYEEAANKILSTNARVYYSSGADEQITLRDNILAYKRYIMLPRMLVGVSNRKISTTILGKAVSLPIGVSPVGLQKLGCPEGEIATAKAASAFGSIFILSTFSHTKIEDIALESPYGRKWMQVYIFKKRAVTVNLIKRAEFSGFEAIVVTIDAPVSGFKREMKRLSTRPNLPLANFGAEMRGLLGASGRQVTSADVINNYDPSINWDDIIWLKSVTTLPIFLKGILNADDAERGIQLGARGIFVSNHGGRQLDTVISTIDILPEIAKRLRFYNATILVDGGIRKGTDIFKALAFGADMVFAGRPFVWGLSVSGETGVKNIFNIFKDEFNSTMALAGVNTVGEIDENYVGRSKSPQPLLYT